MGKVTEITMEFPFNTSGWNDNELRYKRKADREKINTHVHKWLWENGFYRFKSKCTVKFIRQSHQPMDEDSVGASSKYWLDALVRFKVIQDDKPISAGGHVHIQFFSRKGDPATIIHIKKGVPAEADTP